MATVKPHRMIYELENQDYDSVQSPRKKPKKDKSNLIDRKIGIATYSKWGNVYNYHFSFDLQRGRLLCYKNEKQRHPNNYYTLIQGQFVEEEDEINRKEKIFMKKKTYIPPPMDDPLRSVIYVRTRKGKTFRLVTNVGESHDQITGYLQICFNSKAPTDAKAFVAMLGSGAIKVLGRGFKLSTGILVPLDNWNMQQSPQKYLKQAENQKDAPIENPDPEGSDRFQQLISNLPVIGGIIGAFGQKPISLVFDPISHTIDAITFDSEGQPNQFFHEIFLLVRRVRTSFNRGSSFQHSQTEHLNENEANKHHKHSIIRLNSIVQDKLQSRDYIQVSENRQVQMFCKKCYLPLLNPDDVQSSMMTTEMIDEIQAEIPNPLSNPDDDEALADEDEVLVSSTYQFYKAALSYYPKQQIYQSVTKEFIIIKTLKLINDEIFRPSVQNNNENQIDVLPTAFRGLDESIEEEITDKYNIQTIKTIIIDMKRCKNSDIYQQTTLQKEQIEIQQKHFIDENQKKKDKFNFQENEIQKLNETIVEKTINHNNNTNNNQQAIRRSLEVLITPDDKNKLQPVIQVEVLPSLVEPLQKEQEIEEQENEEEEDEDQQDIDGDNEDNIIAKAGAKAAFPHQKIKGYNNIMKYATEFVFLKQKDEYRVPFAHKSGGSSCLDNKIVELSRSVGKTMIKEIGRKIISGNFNLTTVSFPIKAMIPKSGLEKTFMQTTMFPLYMNRACSISDPLERIKLLMVATISNFPYSNTFLKPLNPIIGETFEGSYDDGSLLYGEQISHHPPVSYFLMYGPKNSYKFSGYYLYDVNAGLNSLSFKNQGKRQFTFKDGQTINFDFNMEQYSGTFMGTIKHESTGTINFRDEANQIVAYLTIGKVKKKPTDYVEGEIKKAGKLSGKLYGSYMGFIEWDSNRYWDAREVLPFMPKVESSQLLSDHTFREDRIQMLKGDMIKAQIVKEELEVLQRKDAKLRKEAEKIRQAQEKKKKK